MQVAQHKIYCSEWRLPIVFAQDPLDNACNPVGTMTSSCLIQCNLVYELFKFIQDLRFQTKGDF